MTRAALRPLLLVLAAVLLLAGCAAPSATLAPPPPVPTSVAGNGLAVVPYTDPPTVTGAYAAQCHVRIVAGKQLPDPACTPGSVAVSSDQQAGTICRAGWTKTVRPDDKLTGRAKTAAMRAYNIPESSRDRVEFDHLVPLTLGGSNDVTNLWPQLSDLPASAGFLNSKDRVETQLGRAVCAGRVDLARAQRAIADNWSTALTVVLP